MIRERLLLLYTAFQITKDSEKPETISWVIKTSVDDPDPELDPDLKQSDPFGRIRIRIRKMGSDPDPEPTGPEYKFYLVKLDFLCFKNYILSLRTVILTSKLVQRRTSLSKMAFSQRVKLCFQENLKKCR
jgi:hypothetical protein